MRACALLVVLLSLACPVAAQSRRIPDALALARVCASEGGLLVAEHECAAIAAVLRSRCPECSLATSARAYSGRVFDLTRDDPRAWVAHLREDGREPARWSVLASWSAHRANWLRILEAAERIVRGELTASCEPHHWGASYGIDLERALRAGWLRVDCGEGVRNLFWRRPS